MGDLSAGLAGNGTCPKAFVIWMLPAAEDVAASQGAVGAVERHEYAGKPKP
jgi:hypothetical protein